MPEIDTQLDNLANCFDEPIVCYVLVGKARRNGQVGKEILALKLARNTKLDELPEPDYVG